MKFARYSDWNQLPESASALFRQREKDSVFFSRSWFECLTANALEIGHTLVLACVVAEAMDGDKVMAILPLMEIANTRTNNKTWYSLKHGFTPHYSFLLADDEQETVLSCLAQALNQLQINGLLLEPVADDDYALNSLRRHLEQSGFSCNHIFRHYNWIYRLQGKSYKEYIADRPARLRNTISRKQRKLQREHGYEIRFYTGEEVLQHMADYYVVYDASWKQNEIKNADFQDCFVEKFTQAESSWSRLAILYVKEQPIAAQLWFVHHKKASIFRLAYDKAWRHYSTGSILTSFLMEYVIDTDKVNEIDFLTGNDAYKQDWMSERRERFLLSCVKSIIPPSGYERFIQSLRRMLKIK